MGAVLAIAVEAFEQGDLVVLVIAVRILQAVEAAVTQEGGIVLIHVDHDIEAMEGIEETVGEADLPGPPGGIAGELEGDGIHFDLLGGIGANRRNGQPVEIAVLVGGDHASFVVEGHGDPGALVMDAGTIQMVCVETCRQPEVVDLGIF